MTALLLAVALFAIGDDSLAVARDLYASAAYEDALAMLNRLPANRPPDETRAVAQYRALCLLALGRTSEAERAIEVVVSNDPSYRPATDVSPRVRAAFSEVRKRMLPSILEQKYAKAKAAYDRKEYAAASAGFTTMLEMMTDPDALAVSNQPPLSDLRTLAAGFRDLADSAAAPPPAPAPTPAPAPPRAPAAVVPEGPRVYAASDANVIPPIVIQQSLPPYPGKLLTAHSGVIELLIDENGVVETAMMRQSVSPQYDSLALNAAKMWRYRPATVNGVPVRYRKAVAIALRPETRRE